MSASDLVAVKVLLKKLKPAELEHVRGFAAALLLGTAKEENKVVEDDLNMLVLDAIRSAMESHGIEFTSVARLQKSPAYKSFLNKMDEGVGHFLATSARTNRIALKALVNISIDLLYINLRKMFSAEIAIGSQTMMVHTHRIPAVVDAAFPGYARSGALHLVVRSEHRLTTEKRDVREKRNSRKKLLQRK